jgi:hypothetical protein
MALPSSSASLRALVATLNFFQPCVGCCSQSRLNLFDFERGVGCCSLCAPATRVIQIRRSSYHGE